MSKAKDKRNKEIYKDWHSGIGLTQLVIKYKISQTRIVQIIDKIMEEK